MKLTNKVQLHRLILGAQLSQKLLACSAVGAVGLRENHNSILSDGSLSFSLGGGHGGGGGSGEGAEEAGEEGRNGGQEGWSRRAGKRNWVRVSLVGAASGGRKK